MISLSLLLIGLLIIVLVLGIENQPAAWAEAGAK